MANRFNEEKRKKLNLKRDPVAEKKARDKRKKKLAVSVIVVAVLLGILALFAYVIIPAIVGVENIGRGEIITGNFYSEDEITEEVLAEYEKEYKYKGYISYTKDGQMSFVNSDSAYSFGGSAAELFIDYFDAVSNGDRKAYSRLFADDFDNSKDPYASGVIDFPPQRIYDVKIEVAEEYIDKETNIIKGTFFVDYKIYYNEGDFRIDIDRENSSSVLVFETEQIGDEVKIVDVYHRYGN